LFLSYVIGLWFTLRTHAAVIWSSEVDEKKTHGNEVTHAGPPRHVPLGPNAQSSLSNTPDVARSLEIRDSQLYKKILGQSLKQAGLPTRFDESSRSMSTSTQYNASAGTPHLVPPKSAGDDSVRSAVHVPGFSEAENNNLAREVVELAATAAAIAARDAAQTLRKESHPQTPGTGSQSHKPSMMRTSTILGMDTENTPAADAPAAGGHDAPNWSRTKSSVILMGATILYAMIAEILVNTVDVVLEGVAIDEKFIGITLFALVPNTTEFLVSAGFLNG
jgi:Ca2+:H+ antiporter